MIFLISIVKEFNLEFSTLYFSFHLHLITCEFHILNILNNWIVV